MTIAILPYQWAADLNSMFGLGRKLERRGHRVVFCCVPDVAERVRAQGFGFKPFLEEAFPPGSLRARNLDEAEGRVQESEGFDVIFANIREALEDRAIDRAIEEVRPDALLVSSWTPWVAIAAYRTGLPVVCFSSILISIRDSGVPPFGSDTIPRDTIQSRLRTLLAWETMFLRRRLLGNAIQIRAELRDLARICSFPTERIDFRTETWPRLSYPELVLCPAEFDFPRRHVPAGARFVEACVDLERKDVAFPWDRIVKDRPLVVCSLGSVVVFKFRSRAERLIQCFLDAMAAHPRWQGVAAVGRFIDPDRLRRPDNVVLVDEAPQVELLRLASLLVTHGGLTSIKESIRLGVPMVVVPFYFDQPGNAARVVYHRLGRRGRLEALTPGTLGSLMDDALESPSCRESVTLMSRTFAELEERSPATAAIEAVLGGDRDLRSLRLGEGSPPPPRS